MIARYTREEMGRVWGEANKIACWLRVEIAVCEAWHRRGRIPAEAMSAIRAATCDLDRMREIEREVDHDVIAFLRATGESVGEASRYIHLGLTSSDVIDTATALQFFEATDVLLGGLRDLRDAVGVQAVRHKRTLMIGRTHGVHAEPTTFGLKLAVWYDELGRQLLRLQIASADVLVGKVSGAVGTHAHVPPDFEEEVCNALGLTVAPASTQVIQRDRHAYFLSTLAVVGATIEKMATEIRHLQRTEVREAEEPFDPGNQGSSAMPHKRNPHASERLTGLARLLRGYALVAQENVALWHERDISHSSAERVIFPDACIVLDFMLAEATDLIGRLVVYPERMRQNLESTAGAIYSQPAMLALVDAGMDRQAAYKIVQRLALDAWDHGTSLRDALAADPEVVARVAPGVLDRVFDPLAQLQHVDAIFDRVGLGDAERGDDGED